MKLHQAKKGSKVKIQQTKHYLGNRIPIIDEQEVLTYLEDDGIYCICSDDEGNKTHHPSWLDIILIEEPND
jgi:hypothetical protein|tara:strand:+ start:62 stop:274 length:213 start_codon:yes stop_codon:yes gene_type:complete